MHIDVGAKFLVIMFILYIQFSVLSYNGLFDIIEVFIIRDFGMRLVIGD